jgi:RimJ/RimL family protein N-acetyltransferase
MSERVRLKRVDKQGIEFEIGEVGPEAANDLIAMYDDFGQLAISQGLPPAEKDQRRKWIEKLLEHGRNFLGWVDGRAVGHCAIIPDYERADAEYIIFVKEKFRNRGIGTALTELTLESAKTSGLNRIWLTVEAFNFRAIRLYRNSGFVFIDQDERERTMMLRL